MLLPYSLPSNTRVRLRAVAAVGREGRHLLVCFHQPVHLADVLDVRVEDPVQHGEQLGRQLALVALHQRSARQRQSGRCAVSRNHAAAWLRLAVLHKHVGKLVCTAAQFRPSFCSSISSRIRRNCPRPMRPQARRPSPTSVLACPQRPLRGACTQTCAPRSGPTCRR